METEADSTESVTTTTQPDSNLSDYDSLILVPNTQESFVACCISCGHLYFSADGNFFDVNGYVICNNCLQGVVNCSQCQNPIFTELVDYHRSDDETFWHIGCMRMCTRCNDHYADVAQYEGLCVFCHTSENVSLIDLFSNQSPPDIQPTIQVPNGPPLTTLSEIIQSETHSPISANVWMQNNYFQSEQLDPLDEEYDDDDDGF